MPYPLKRLFLQTIGKVIPSDVFSHRFPVSVKGICFIENKVILLKNEHQAWDLPGGKLKRGEEITDCLVREIAEELSIPVQVDQLWHATTLNMRNTINVLILIYRCSTNARLKDLRLSAENFGIGAFTLPELTHLNLADEYLTAIQKAYHIEI